MPIPLQELSPENENTGGVDHESVQTQDSDRVDDPQFPKFTRKGKISGS